jgi:hypothetical protein
MVASSKSRDLEMVARRVVLRISVVAAAWRV